MPCRFVTSIALLIAAAVCPDRLTQDGSAIPPVTVEGFGIYGLVHDFSAKTSVSLGLEDFIISSQQRPAKIELPAGSLIQDLDQIAAQYPNHVTRRLGQGAFEIVGPGPYGPGDVVINFKGLSNGGRRDVWNSLAQDPTLDKWLSENKCEREQIISGKEWRHDSNSITISAGPIQLRNLLATAAAQSDVKFWAILRSQRDTGCKITFLLW